MRELLIHMGVSSGLLIAAILVLRALLIKRLPKRLFRALWIIAAARMLLPFSIPILPAAEAAHIQPVEYNVIESRAEVKTIVQPEYKNQAALQVKNDADDLKTEKNSGKKASLPGIIYFSGVIVSVLYFEVSHMKIKKRCGRSLPLWHGELKGRKISIRKSDETASPLTYGVFRRVIILPDKSYTRGELKYILAHEAQHILNYDTLLKRIIAAAVCLHWFDPLAWAMLVFSERDIELACDEAVLKKLGGRKEYAMTLIGIAEMGAHTAAFFGGSSVKERIEMIMRYKKTTIAAAAVSVCIALGSLAAFASETQNSGANEKTPALTAQSSIAESQAESAADESAEDSTDDSKAELEVEVETDE